MPVLIFGLERYKLFPWARQVCYDSSGGEELYPTFTCTILKGCLVGSLYNNQLGVLVERAIAVVLERVRAGAVERKVMAAAAVMLIVVAAVTATVTAKAVMAQ